MAAPEEEVLVSDLMKMSADELSEISVICLKDPDNLTAENIEKLKCEHSKHLSVLHMQISNSRNMLLVNGLDRPRALRLRAVVEKLSKLADALLEESKTWISSSTTPDLSDPVTAEQYRYGQLLSENRAYHDLIQDGGRPSHRPDSLGFEYLDEPQTGIIKYWVGEGSEKQHIFSKQLGHWKLFRELQDRTRSRYWKPKWFERFVQEVSRYRQRKGLEGNVSLLQDRKEQSKLQDWVEFQYQEYREADRLVREEEDYAADVERIEEEFQAAKDAKLPWNEINRIRGDALWSAKNNRDYLRTELDRKEILLQWIDEQLLIIARECQVSITSTQGPHGGESPFRGADLGKRKESTDSTEDVERRHRRVRFADLYNQPSLPANAGDKRGPKLSCLRKSHSSRTANPSHQDEGHKSSETRADGDSILNSDTFRPVHCNPLPKSTGSERSSSIEATPVQAQDKNCPVQAGPKTDDSCQQSGVTSTEDEVTPLESAGTRDSLGGSKTNASCQQSGVMSTEEEVTPLESAGTRDSLGGSKTNASCQQSGTTSIEEEVTPLESAGTRDSSVGSGKRRSRTTSISRSTAPRRVYLPRVAKTRAPTRTEAPAKAACSGNTRQPSRKGKQKAKPLTTRGGKDVVQPSRQKQRTAEAPVRRSERHKGKPPIRYWVTKIIL